MRRGRLAAFVAAGAVCSLGGCGGQDVNARPVLGGKVSIAALRATGPGAARGLVDDEASLATVSRAEWRAQRFEVPVDGTVHGPIRRWGWTAAGGNPRRSGLWPTLESALRVNGEPGRSLTVEGWAAWIEAIGEVVCLPFEVVTAPGLGQGGRRASPWAMAKRYPETGEWTSVSAGELLGAEREQSERRGPREEE